MVVDMDGLIEEIDAFLARSASRELFSTSEVQNMLLDLRSKLQSDPTQS